MKSKADFRVTLYPCLKTLHRWQGQHMQCLPFEDPELASAYWQVDASDLRAG